MNAVTLTLHPAAMLGLTALGEELPVSNRPGASRPPAPGGANASVTRMLRALQASGLPAATFELARGALHKMAAASSLLAGADGLESGLAAVMAAQAKQSDQQLELAKTRVQSKFDQLKLKNLAEREQIQKRVEAARASGLWSKLVTFFKAIGAALAAASSIFTGPAGIAASALLIVSIIVSAAKPDGWGQWLSLGLSLAAVALGGYAALANLAAAASGGIVGTVTTATQATSEAAAAGCTIAKGKSDKDGLLAQAALTDLRALKKQLLAEADEDCDEMKTIIEAEDRCVKAVVRAFETHQAAAMAALRR